jgi:hypothetical protein
MAPQGEPQSGVIGDDVLAFGWRRQHGRGVWRAGGRQQGDRRLDTRYMPQGLSAVPGEPG